METGNMKRVRALSFGMLGLVLCALFFFHLDPWRSTRIFDSYVNLVPFVFLGITLCVSRTRRSVDIWLSYAWIGWFILSRGLLGDLYFVRSSILWFHYDCLATLFALSFAWVMQDGQKMQGLKLTAVVMILIVTVLYTLGLYAVWTGKTVSIPRIGGNIGFTPDFRLNILTHPNNTGAIALLTLMLIIWLVASCRKRWLMIVCAIAFLIVFAACAMTSSRTSMIQIACFLGMMAALAVLRRPPKALGRKWMRFACAALAAVLVLLVAYNSFGWVVSGVNAAKSAAESKRVAVETVEAQPETAAKADAPRENHVRERALGEHLTTLTGRTDIYARAIEILRNDPEILWLGTAHRNELALGEVNAHNAYLQVALCLGIPGLLIAVAFSLRALWLSFKVFFLRFDQATVPELILACMIPVMMLNTITECYLFYDAVPIFNVIFFLIYGYLSEVERRLRKA